MIVPIAPQNRIPSEYTGAARAAVVLRSAVIKRRLHFASGVMGIHEVGAVQADLDNGTAPSRLQPDTCCVNRRVALKVQDRTALRRLRWEIDAQGDRRIMYQGPAGCVQCEL
ncbi:MAG: hypothetical protein DMG40_00455 [Acidobacteria bacterium]|nr:MAG: hypothetical protein DMG40_00455 [Acidobacteriota bacterium]